MMNSAISKAPPAAEQARLWVTEGTALQSAHLVLDRGQHVWLRANLATHLTGVSGIAWITFERGTDDLVLLPGQWFVVSAKTTVLIGPLQGSAQLDARGAFEIMGHPESHAVAGRNWH